MIRQNNEQGSVRVSASVYTDIAGTAASNCFGVKGMAAAPSPTGCITCSARNPWARV